MDQKADIKRAFTTAERDQIRDALLRYLRERQVGVPILHKEIYRHDPLGRDIELKTLQRFLGNKHRTQDDYVSICHEFAKSLPYFSAEQHITLLGGALANFTATAPSVNSEWFRNNSIELDVRYSSAAHTGPGLSMVKKDAGFADLTQYSTLVLERSADESYFRTSETIHNAFPDLKRAEAVRATTDGIAVPAEDRYLFWVGRDNLTQRPRSTIWALQEGGNGAGAFLLVISPQNPDEDEQTYVSPVRLFAMHKRSVAEG